MVKKIDQIKFRGDNVNIFYHPEQNVNSVNIVWQARNPESFYKGIAYLSEDGKLTYPKDAIIPEQTKEDRELIPKAIVTGKETLDNISIKKIINYLKKDFKRRNTNG